MNDPTRSDDDPLYVPAEFEHAHLEEARHRVHRSVELPPWQRPWRRRRALQLCRLNDPVLDRWLAVGLGLVALIGVLVLALAGLSDTWPIGAAVAALLALASFGLVRVVRSLDQGRNGRGHEQNPREATGR